MNPILRNILAVVLGWIGGSFINLGLINLGHKLMPVEGLDPNNMDALVEIMPTLDAQYFIFPFLAHALGTLIGAIIAGVIAANNKMKFSLAIGALFFIGGIMVNYMVTGPMWFTVVDILFAYIPIAWIGGRITLRFLRYR